MLPATEHLPETTGHATALETKLKIDKISNAIRLVLETLGEIQVVRACGSPQSDLPRSCYFSLKVTSLDPAVILKDAIFHEHHQGLVLVKDIEFSSYAEHRHSFRSVGKGN